MNQQLEGEAFHSLWRILLDKVQRRFFWLDQASIEDALGETILHRWAQNSGESEKARKGTGKLSVSSLYSEACRRVSDSMRADRRRYRREREYICGKKNWFLEDFFVPNGFSAANISTEQQKDELARLLKDCSTWEQGFVQLRAQGCREATAYAEVLGVSHCSHEEQQNAINRAWNRLRKKLQRRRKRWMHDSDH